VFIDYATTLLTIFPTGALESPKVITLQSSCKSSGTDGTLDGNDAFGLYSMGSHISGIPEDMLASQDWGKIPDESQRRLHTVLKPKMAKLCQVLHLSVSGLFHLHNLF
jgi:hypothetical protein